MTTTGWKFEQYPKAPGGRIADHRGFTIARLGPYTAPQVAALITAAPDMLLALKNIAARFPLEHQTTLTPKKGKFPCMCNQCLDTEDCRHLDVLRAIAKAEGKP
jgi:hypothetical protein